jgi:hypothetical protein
MINFTQQFNVLEVILATKPPGLGLIPPGTLGNPTILYVPPEVLKVILRTCTNAALLFRTI